jgi:hypothetical protein
MGYKVMREMEWRRVGNLAETGKKKSKGNVMIVHP